ncbi:MAG TPA: aspartyl protease family protein [Pirellulales bacterium]|nr:aspartyl protease family protein [Pirellulales bacterium]
MRIDGYWLTCDDGISRPVVDGHVVGLNDVAFYERFLVDIGADRTVFSAHLARKLGLPTEATSESKVVGVGGEAAFVLVKTVIQVLSDKGTTVRLKGEFAAFQDETAIDLCVMGRDLLNHFDCIVSHRNAEVVLLAPNHRYVVVPG